MAVRLTLRYNKKPSHALTVTEPWTRWLVETESVTGKGHVIGTDVALRKSTNALNVITGIEVEQLQRDPLNAQRYLQVCEWWLHRDPFGVQRLGVKLVSHQCAGLLVDAAGWRVESLDLSRSMRFLEWHAISSFLRSVREVDVSDTRISDLTAIQSAEHLEVLCVNNCRGIRDLGPLRLCDNLRTVRLSYTAASDLHPLGEVSTLQEVEAVGTSVVTLNGLHRCTRLKKVNVSMCATLIDISALNGAAALEELAARRAAIITLAGLSSCTRLRILNVAGCRELTDLSDLGSPPALEEIDISESGVSTLAGLRGCMNLKKVKCQWCRSLTDLSDISGVAPLKELDASESAVTTLTGLRSCGNLTKIVFVNCDALGDLSALGGARSLEEIVAPRSGVTRLTGLNNCNKLKRVDFCGCRKLTDLSELAGAPALQVIDARGSGVVGAQGLDTCPKLLVLNLSGSPSAQLSRGV